ncbi:MAG: TfoX/Sxy family protein [Terricaulis sp.]|nr:TfoX/Sxy family protein [Terricaulis sp.]
MAGDSFHDFVRELFAGLGPIQIKRMFGGAGVYAEGRMFALLADEVIYLKADAALKAALEVQGCGPFVWAPQAARARARAWR